MAHIRVEDLKPHGLIVLEDGTVIDQPRQPRLASATVSGRTVREALGRLCEQYEDLRRDLFTKDGQLQRSVGVFVNDDDLFLDLQGLETRLTESDTIFIFRPPAA